MPKSREARLFAAQLVEQLVVPTFVLDPQGRVIIWNRACERLTGLSASEVLGTNQHWKGFYNEPRPCLADLVLQGSSGEQLYAEFAYLSSDTGGLTAKNWCAMPQARSRRYLAVDAAPVCSDDGELLAVVETLRDITEQHQAQVALHSLANVDGLTGIANRRAFDTMLEQECNRARRAESPLSLLMIDIDRFKAFNDAFGHQAGDECLKQVASAIGTSGLRPGDFPARYGGEEFAVILPATSGETALTVANRLREAVERLALPHPKVPGRVVTVSVGVASKSAPEEAAPAALIASADEALYHAKRAGRNRVVVSGHLKRRAA
jgi:diguanylate cyclase (GGDEF)-like protein